MIFLYIARDAERAIERSEERRMLRNEDHHPAARHQ